MPGRKEACTSRQPPHVWIGLCPTDASPASSPPLTAPGSRTTRTAASCPRNEAEPASPAGPSVLLTNGIGTSENFRRYIVADLEQDHRVVHWNYRGHGHSDEARNGDYSVDAHVDDLERVTEEMMRQAMGGLRTTSPSPWASASSGAVPPPAELVPAMTLIAGGAPGRGSGARGWIVGWATGHHAPGVIPDSIGALALTVVRAFLASPLAYPRAGVTGASAGPGPAGGSDEFFAALRRMSPRPSGRRSRA